MVVLSEAGRYACFLSHGSHSFSITRLLASESVMVVPSDEGPRYVPLWSGHIHDLSKIIGFSQEGAALWDVLPDPKISTFFEQVDTGDSGKGPKTKWPRRSERSEGTKCSLASGIDLGDLRPKSLSSPKGCGIAVDEARYHLGSKVRPARAFFAERSDTKAKGSESFPRPSYNADDHQVPSGSYERSVHNMDRGFGHDQPDR